MSAAKLKPAANDGANDPLVRSGWEVTGPPSITMCKPFPLGYLTPKGSLTKSLDIFSSDGKQLLQHIGNIDENSLANFMWATPTRKAVNNAKTVTLRVGQVRNGESGYGKQTGIKVIPYTGKTPCWAANDTGAPAPMVDRIVASDNSTMQASGDT
ncbi:hypothetical protein T439DRAFT_380969 [Meredithblackwellia eburnea MCA 4105]